MSGDLSLDEIRFILEEHGYNYIQAIGEGGFGEVLLVHSHKYHSHFCCKVRPLKRVKKRSSKNEISDHSNRPAASNSALSKKDSNLPSNSDGNDHPEISDQNANLFGDQIFNKIDDEIAINIKLEHPNIISIFDHFTVRDTVFIIMEYCPNGSLDEYIKSYGKICPPMLYSLCYQIASSVKKCHNYLVAHRDIKPANILLDLRCRPKLADFGISCDL
ncbi:hypothetical protein TRFO_03701 [Tritrichomonas foetus]|uniref:Protein kinase domain-containing protein n=1 Tax=Tritrichomonas foetus TaxID=1144522 RepID=A0A1J4KQL9_9EUKA|nr:hypothetical protein TRFO_03701 [Tritrichomonas foetus]|eukprot:OHT12084.1 hypothetical protein TRFO_03701 [Tritrichomonas foetus]